MKMPISEALWVDCENDNDRVNFLISGRAHETGIIALAIQNEVANAFAFRQEATEAFKQNPISPADWPWQRPTKDGQACWELIHTEIGWQWKLSLNSLSGYMAVIASHPQGLPPPDGFRVPAEPMA